MADETKCPLCKSTERSERKFIQPFPGFANERCHHPWHGLNPARTGGAEEGAASAGTSPATSDAAERLAEIKARLEPVARRLAPFGVWREPKPPYNETGPHAEFIAHAPRDIAWLIEQLQSAAATESPARSPGASLDAPSPNATGLPSGESDARNEVCDALTEALVYMGKLADAAGEDPIRDLRDAKHMRALARLLTTRDPEGRDGDLGETTARLWQRIGRALGSSAVPSEDSRRLDRLQALLDRRGEHGFKGCISIGHDDEAESGDDQTEVNLWAGEDGWSQPWVSSGDSLRAAIDAIPDAAMASPESPALSGDQNEAEGATRAAHPAETPASREGR